MANSPGRRARRGTPHRSRSILFWGGLIFLTVQLVAGLLLDYRWPLLRFPSAAHLLADVRRQPAPPDFVFFGSSRFASGVAAEEVERLVERECRLRQPLCAVNASVPAGDLVTAEFLLRRLIDEGRTPRVAVVEVSPETLNLYNEWLIYHIRRQIHWHNVPTYFLDICRVRLALFLAADRLFPLFVHRREVLGAATAALEKKPAAADLSAHAGVPRRVAASGPVDWDELLKYPKYPMPKEKRDLIAFTARNLPGRWLRRFAIGGTAAEALERLLCTCRQKGIRVVLVGVPVTAPHRQTYSPTIEEAFRAHMATITRTHGCRYVDYRDRVPDELFMDNHHLDPDGKVYFTRLLTREVLSPLWQAEYGGEQAVTANRPR